jgi:AcrR family transcriptional regulator
LPITPTTQRRRPRAEAHKPRSYAPDATRQAIIDSALALFERNGFHATSVQAVADDADVTKGAFYHHFESKDQLVQIIHDELLDYMLRELRSIDETVSGPDAQLRAVIRAIVHTTVRFRSHVAVYYHERRYLADARFRGVRRKHEEVLERTGAILRAGIDDGTFRGDIDPTVATCGIHGMAGWAHQWLRANGTDPEQVAILLADMVLGGVAKR